MSFVGPLREVLLHESHHDTLDTGPLDFVYHSYVNRPPRSDSVPWSDTVYDELLILAQLVFDMIHTYDGQYPYSTKTMAPLLAMWIL